MITRENVESFSFLITALEKAQSKGLFNLQEAAQVNSAIDNLTPMYKQAIENIENPEKKAERRAKIAKAPRKPRTPKKEKLKEPENKPGNEQGQ